jgi:virginiamycin B lyase
MKQPLAVLLLAAATAGSAALSDTKPAEIKEWTVPWASSRPRDPYVAPDGKVWFVGQTADYAAYLVPATGEFKRYELESGAGPHNLIVDARGLVWYAGNRDAYIGKLDPKDGRITKFPMPDPAARDPHTLVFDSKGDIWFTVQGGNFIGKLATASGAVRLVRVPTPNARPYGIEIDSKDRPWVVLFGTNMASSRRHGLTPLRDGAGRSRPHLDRGDGRTAEPVSRL